MLASQALLIYTRLRVCYVPEIRCRFCIFYCASETRSLHSSHQVLLVALTGDRGLCGGYNTYAIKKAEMRAKELQGQGIDFDMICIGNKGNTVRPPPSPARLPPFKSLETLPARSCCCCGVWCWVGTVCMRWDRGSWSAWRGWRVVVYIMCVCADGMYSVLVLLPVYGVCEREVETVKRYTLAFFVLKGVGVSIGTYTGQPSTHPGSISEACDLAALALLLVFFCFCFAYVFCASVTPVCRASHTHVHPCGKPHMAALMPGMEARMCNNIH